MKIIQKRERIENTSFTLFFGDKKCPRAGWAPSCDKEGNVLGGTLQPAAMAEWKRVQSRMDAILAGTDAEYHPPEVQSFTNSYWQPAIGICDACKRRVHLDGFTNSCECGADYNMSGQRLADRSQWGEDTGESVSEILRIK